MAREGRIPRPPRDGLRIGQVSGIPIIIHPSWVVSLLVLSLYTEPMIARVLFPNEWLATRLIIAMIAVLPIVVSIVAHELAHALVARQEGISTDRITLFAFGGVSQLRGLAKTAGAEYRIAAAGPILSLVVATFLAAIARTQDPVTVGLSGVLGAYAWVNLALAIFNLLPAFPMDGGRVLRALLWRLLGDRDGATRWAALVGRGFALLIVSFGIAVVIGPVVRGGPPDPSGIWTALIGAFLFSAVGVAEEGEADNNRTEREHE